MQKLRNQSLLVQPPLTLAEEKALSLLERMAQRVDAARSELKNEVFYFVSFTKKCLGALKFMCIICKISYRNLQIGAELNLLQVDSTTTLMQRLEPQSPVVKTAKQMTVVELLSQMLVFHILLLYVNCEFLGTVSNVLFLSKKIIFSERKLKFLEVQPPIEMTQNLKNTPKYGLLFYEAN